MRVRIGQRGLAVVLAVSVVLASAALAFAASDQPNWDAFMGSPPLDGSSTTGDPSDPDPRRVLCFPAGSAPSAPCEISVRASAAATPFAWDVDASATTPAPTATTRGNNADAALSALSPFTPGPDRSVRPTSPTREYRPPWTNTWRSSACNPSVFAGGIAPATGPGVFGGTNGNDVNAAIINLFATLNRLHDWTYDLGFTEARHNFQTTNFGKGGSGGDAVLGEAQAAALDPGGGAAYLAGPAATPGEGTPPTIEMHLWQPVAATFYGPCVDGDLDASLVAQVYGRATADRMVAGPADGVAKTSGPDGQAQALREGWADVIAAEFLRDTADSGSPVIGAYVSGNPSRGLRNHAMTASPLNFSNVRGWDGSGAGTPGDDGEIWAAALFEVRKAYVARYGAPGTRRFLRVLFDSLPGIGSDASMLRARDAFLARAAAADRTRVWRAFARRGFGERAAGTVSSTQPRPSFASPREAGEAHVTFRLRARDEGGRKVKGRVFVGRYEANVTPLADTNPATPLPAAAVLVPGTYAFVFQAPGYGAVKTTLTFGARARRIVTVWMPTNQASRAKGARATGGGSGAGAVLDDTEATNWTGTGADSVSNGALAVTVNLAGTRPRTVDRIQVSALLRAASPAQNRFTALRSFSLRTCSASAARTCASSADYRPLGGVYEPFAAGAPRPLTPDLTLRTIDVPNRKATHLRLVVLDNQCTGGPAYRGALETDPDHEADCVLGAPDVARTVRVAELQVFSRAPAVSVASSRASRAR